MPPPVLDGQEEPLKRMAKIVQAFINHADSGPFREPVDWRGLELFDYPEVVKRMMDLGTIARKLDRHQYSTAWECAQDIRLVWKNCMSYNAEGSDFWLLAKSLSRKFEDRFRRIRQEFDVGEASEERPGGGDSGGDDSEGGSEGEDSEGDEDDPDDNNDEDDEEEFQNDDDDNDDPRAPSRSSNGHRLSNASAMSSNGSVTSAGGNGSGPASLDARAQLAANLLLLQGTELGHILMTLERECPAALEVNDGNTGKSSSHGVPEKLEIVLDVLEGALFTKIATYASEKATIRKRGMAAAGGSAAVDTTINDISGKKRRRK